MAAEASRRRPSWWPSEIEVELLRGACAQDAGVAGEIWRRLVASGSLGALRGDAARLLPLLYERLCAAGVNGTELQPLRRAYAEVRSLNVATRTQAREALQRLVASGVSPMLLKGLAIDAMAGERGTRRIGDLDLMVRHDQLGVALGALEEGGWHATDSSEPGALVAKHSTCLRRPDTVEVDLHWVLSGRLALHRDPGAAMALFWGRARPAVYLGLEVLTLHPMHQLLHLLVHGALVESRATARWLADAWFVLRHARECEVADWRSLVDDVRSLGVSLQTWAALRCLDYVFPGVVPPAVLAELRASRWSLAERLLWLLDSRTVRQPLALDVVRTLRSHLSNQRFRALPSALLLYPRYLTANGYVVSPVQLARHVARRRRERRERAPGAA